MTLLVQLFLWFNIIQHLQIKPTPYCGTSVIRTNKIVDESSTGYISLAARSYQCKRARPSRKIFLSFSINTCSKFKLYDQTLLL